jgi:four helix bundle protein
MSTVTSFRDLGVWQAAMDLAVAVYRETKNFPLEERYGLRAQIRDAATSVPSNIAEGHSRSRTGAYLQHLSIASGSLAELDTRIELARRLRLLPDDAAARLVERMRRLGRMLGSLIRSMARLERTQSGRHQPKNQHIRGARVTALTLTRDAAPNPES